MAPSVSRAARDGLMQISANLQENSYFVREDAAMFMGIAIGPIVSLIAGILILFMPRLLNYIVAIYLIIIGVIGLLARYAGSAV